MRASDVTGSDVTGSDVALIWNGDVVAGVRLPLIHGSLERIIAVVENELGERLPMFARPGKQ